MTERIRVDALELTLGEMAEVAEAAGVTDGDAPGANFRYTAALAWAMKRRTEPEFTYEQALALRMGDLEIVEHADPEAEAAASGGTPQSSPEPGS